MCRVATQLSTRFMCKNLSSRPEEESREGRRERERGVRCNDTPLCSRLTTIKYFPTACCLFFPLTLWHLAPSVYRFKVLLCVPAQRPHVLNVWTYCQHSQSRFECTQIGGSQSTRGLFSVCHTTPTSTLRTTDTTYNTHHPHTLCARRSAWISHFLIP